MLNSKIWFEIYADFGSILMPENKWKQNPYKNIHQKNIVRSYSYQLVCVDKFSKPFKTYLGKDAVYNFINSMIEESKYCCELIKNIFTKNL